MLKNQRKIPNTPSDAVKNGRNKLLLRRVTLTAVFIALAVVVKLTFSITLPLFGASGMKVGLAGIFTTFPAILCGPVYGGIASAASDIIGVMIKPDGAYIPWLTLTAFAGGVIKGLIWLGLDALRRRRKERAGISRVTLRVALPLLLVLLGIAGGAFHLSLTSDGVITDFVAVANDIPTRGALETADKNGEISPLSGAVISLAQYKNDTFSLISAADAVTVSVPSEVVRDGYAGKLTKIIAGAFSSCGAMTRVEIPSSVKTIDTSAFNGLDPAAITIAAPSGSAAEKFASENGFAYEEIDLPDAVSTDISDESLYSVKSSETFRKNLVAYINLVTVGLEAVAVAGLLLCAVAVLVRKKTKNAATDDGLSPAAAPNFPLILTSVTVSGLIVTTVNTEILRLFIPAWSTQAFLILWIPRLVEELIVCTVQAFFISLLYEVLTRNLRRYINAFNVKKNT